MFSPIKKKVKLDQQHIHLFEAMSTNPILSQKEREDLEAFAKRKTLNNKEQKRANEIYAIAAPAKHTSKTPRKAKQDPDVQPDQNQVSKKKRRINKQFLQDNAIQEEYQKDAAAKIKARHDNGDFYAKDGKAHNSKKRRIRKSHLDPKYFDRSITMGADSDKGEFKVKINTGGNAAAHLDEHMQRVAESQAGHPKMGPGLGNKKKRKR